MDSGDYTSERFCERGSSSSLSHSRDLSDLVTVYVLTVGDKTSFAECSDHLHSQTVTFRAEVIDHVAPVSAAMQVMIDKCETAYFVQVDEDMNLFPDAIETLLDAIIASPDRTPLVCAGLWDCYSESPIHGVKIYRHSIARQFPFENKYGTDWTQYIKMRTAGYKGIILPLDPSSCIGEHGRNYTPESLFRRWRRLALKHRRYQNMSWLSPWPKLIWERFLRTRAKVDLFAYLGITAGLIEELPEDQAADFRDESGDLTSLTLFFRSGGLSEGCSSHTIGMISNERDP